MTTVTAAWDAGWRRALGAPTLIVALWGATLVAALPLAWALRGQIAAHLGASGTAERVGAGAPLDWWYEFLAQAGGVGQTFVPGVIGFAAVLKNLDGLADAASPPAAVLPVLAAYLGLSIFLLGGVLDRLARDRAVGAGAFFSACGVYFFRFLRLGVLAGAGYWVLFTSGHDVLLGRAYDALTRDVTSERTAFAIYVALALVFGALVVAVNLVFDYAKIRMVVEDRRSAIGALAAGVRFVDRHRGAAIGLYALNALVLAAVLGGYALAAPGVTGAGRIWLVLLVGQLYIVARVVVRLMFAASQIALFQGRLAHAGYTARPVPRWPESAAAEVVRPD